MALVKNYHHHYHFSYNTSFRRHFTAIAVVIVISVLLVLGIFRIISPSNVPDLRQLSPTDLIFATLSTLFRLSVAYVLSLIASVPLAILVTSTPKVEKVLLPLFDILQSVPVLAFFPIIVLAFVKVNFFDGAAIFILFMAMVWNLVFTMIGGIKTIPTEITLAAQVFHATRFKKLWFVTLPSILPYIITGSFLAWAQGWNIMIVAEVLHTYIPGGGSSDDLLGLGSLMVNAVSTGQTSVFLVSLATVIVLIGVLNFFVWQKLLHLTERFKYG